MIPKISKTLTFTLFLCLLLQPSLQQTRPPFPRAVTTAMASRQERYHHYLWHNIRDNWNFFSAATQEQLTNLGWRPPRPSRGRDANGNTIALTDNRSGEDFLYMHRQMIKKVNDIIASTKDPYGPVTGWTTIPAPGDRDWPVPTTYTIPGSPSTTSAIYQRKTLAYYNNNIKPTEDFFKDPVQLRSMTLGQLGSRLENTIHNWLHLRFSANSTVGFRPGASGAIPQIDSRWDNPAYNWLGDTYSSHVNPVFWKLHGWVNDRIIDWARANGLTTITWRGFWVGGPMSSIEAANTALRGQTPSTSSIGGGFRVNSLTIQRGVNGVTASVPTSLSLSLNDVKPVGDATAAVNTTTSTNPIVKPGSGVSSDQVDDTMNEVFQTFTAADGFQESTFADDVKVDFTIPKPKKR